MDYKQKILSAFTDLVKLQGFSKVTVDQLAEHTGISKRTIYRYFNSKEEIITSVVEDFVSQVAKELEQVVHSSSNPVETISNVTMVVCRNIRSMQPLALYDLQKHYPHLWEKIERFRANKIQQVFASLLTNNRQGNFKQINPTIFTAALLATIKAVITPAFIMEHNFSPEEVMQTIFTIFLYGIVEKN